MKNQKNNSSLNYLKIGKKVLLDESDGIAKLAKNLGPEFIDVINCLKLIEGRIIVCGVGKSGHIAKKVSALK